MGYASEHAALHMLPLHLYLDPLLLRIDHLPVKRDPDLVCCGLDDQLLLHAESLIVV